MSGIVFALLWPPAFTFGSLILCRWARGLWRLPLAETAAAGFFHGGLGTIIGYGIAGEWLPVAIGGAYTVIGAVLWWHSRRKNRRKIAEMLGAKSRALRDALVLRVRQAAVSRPVLSPAPGGAR